MFKTFYGLTFKNYFIDSETSKIYHNKYMSYTFCGWFLIVSFDGGKVWEEVKHIQDPYFSDKCWFLCMSKLTEHMKNRMEL